MLEKLRFQIDEIDKEMAILFSKRMDIINEINKEKRKLNISIYQSDREKHIKENNIKYVNVKYKDEYLDFINKILAISKMYQEKNDEK